MRPFKQGDRVVHPKHGPGTVFSLAPSPKVVYVDFDRDQADDSPVGVTRHVAVRKLRPEPRPFTFTRAEDGTLSLETAVFQALGYVSMCWSGGTRGEFLSAEAERAGGTLIALIRDTLQQPPLPPPPPCPAALNIAGEHVPCVEPAPHTGWAHRNPDAQAIWVGPTELAEIEALGRSMEEAGH